jgi:hypothetical protein
MKFDHVLTGPVDVAELDFDPVPLRDRKCSRCNGELFYAVIVYSMSAETHRITSGKHQAMCEGCKLIVDIM